MCRLCQGICRPLHTYIAWEVTGVLGIRDAGSAVRAGLVHYNDRSDVDRLLAAVAELAD